MYKTDEQMNPPGVGQVIKPISRESWIGAEIHFYIDTTYSVLQLVRLLADFSVHHSAVFTFSIPNRLAIFAAVGSAMVKGSVEKNPLKTAKAFKPIFHIVTHNH